MILRELFILLVRVPAAIAQETRWFSLDALATRYPLVRYIARSTQGAPVERHLRRFGVRDPN